MARRWGYSSYGLSELRECCNAQSHGMASPQQKFVRPREDFCFSRTFYAGEAMSKLMEISIFVGVKGFQCTAISDEEFGFQRNPVENQFSRQPWSKHSGAGLESIHLRCLLVLNPPKKSSERLGLEAHVPDPNLPFAECG
ncbi:hypothetical protein RHMOL_Rhmol04G0171000 [Rhododendron molle]|uniref:Uncharacterized protein n=1 Tax=Rhododendron molle TaxID=49168 RepID=A0ACC0P1P4_RHOML|nr:hypothetical protein RHMOL_Rhmol04G0171000 [Rhododendron molle]